MIRTFTFGLTISILLMSYGISATSSQTQNKNPYINQLSSSVRGLSQQEVDNLLNGRGAGYARMAELNSYPGPRHVLDLKEQLKLKPVQVKHIQEVFNKMETEAKIIGKQIVEKEQSLSKLFATRKIDQSEVQARTFEIASLDARLRQVHLNSHLEIMPLLATEQISSYNKLRGYSDSPQNNLNNSQIIHHNKK
jgi:Spy/CpxP family protein refolding chaperone